MTIQMAKDEPMNKKNSDKDKANTKSVSGCTIPPADIKRVKGQGFLNHKRTNKFNARVITRNGRVTIDEMQAICEAAAK